MESTQTLNRIHETIAWGAIFLWWGITELLKFPNGMDALGIGIILLSLMLARFIRRFSTNRFTITLGILALVWGALDLSRSVLHLRLTLGTEFALLLIALGTILVGFALWRIRRLDNSAAR